MSVSLSLSLCQLELLLLVLLSVELDGMGLDSVRWVSLLQESIDGLRVKR